MSLVHTPLVPDHFLPSSLQRKRTASFSVASTSLAASPRPTKAPRNSTAMPLRRTESYLTLPTVASTSVVVISTQGACRPSGSTVPYQQSLQYYKEQRQRHKAVTRASLNLEPITMQTRLERTYTQPHLQSSKPIPFRGSPTTQSSSRSGRSLSRTTTLLDVTSLANKAESTTTSLSCNPTPFRVPSTCRASSPLSPKRHLLPGRPVFPRSKAEPDLYRLAIKTCMRYSPEGQKILQMGPRLALSILKATQDLERMVAEQESRDDAMIEDGARSVTVETMVESEDASSGLSSSWVDMAAEDWEMLDSDDESD
ncbi:hypothetical protein D9756_003030 [Leucocoprinus leucothites]|uniref:Uncharacterized protein n=1 Tax=Leucocoprinus leucothites TaxID=201217 RepID=A0A8H5G6Z8_9AGAR|nr:hypothetical protein D9756_003030 [Leucoagaricus leucothites]